MFGIVFVFDTAITMHDKNLYLYDWNGRYIIFENNFQLMKRSTDRQENSHWYSWFPRSPVIKYNRCLINTL